MAGIDVGTSASSARRVDHELPLIPFIDFLLCLIAFLLVTAVWSQMARLPADASVGQPAECCPPPPSKQLHVDMRRDDQFLLSWKEGSTVVDTASVPRRPTLQPATEQPAYPDLARAIEQQFSQHATHRIPSDQRVNRAILHTAGATPFEHVAAVLDALAAPKRAYATALGIAEIPAFQVTLAAD